MTGPSSQADTPATRHIGLLGATGVGVGAIVGGGILVLGGVAFQSAGPAAMLAFALNGVIGLLTVLSLAELSTAFPESGGAYTYAKKILSVRAAFAVGWITWFAYIVAGVLYALSFASFASAILDDACEAIFGSAPDWLTNRPFVLTLALSAIVLYAVGLIRRASGGGQWETIGKVALFGLLIAAGVAALVFSPVEQSLEHLTPFFTHGATGVLAAMGYTFITIQGFDLIPAVAGEIKQPERTIPRAMKLSLAIGVAIYLPLLFVLATVGVGPDESIVELSARHPDTFVALAVERYLGWAGYWLVMVAVILSTASALQANLLAASRIALAMARDRTLPAVFGRMNESRGTPVMAIYATALATAAILMMVPDLAVAGAAASLIFLLCFGLAHLTSYLARKRASPRPSLIPGGGIPYRAPWFPAVPIAGGAACAGMAVFQMLVVPSAGYVVVVWLCLGLMLYFALFASRAERLDAFVEGQDPKLVSLRGRSPLVLVPLANPDTAVPLVDLATALAPRSVGRVVLLAVMRPPQTIGAMGPPKALLDAQRVLQEALTSSLRAGHRPEALMTVAPAPFSEIERVARTHDCHSLLLGLSGDPEGEAGKQLEGLINRVDCEVVVMHAPVGFRFQNAKRVLIPIGGRGRHHEMRARLLGTLFRTGQREVTFLKIVPTQTTDEGVAAAERDLAVFASEEIPGAHQSKIVRADAVVEAVTAEAARSDLVILGLQETGGERRFGALALAIARNAECATIMVGGDLDPAWHPQQMLDGLKRLPEVVAKPVARD